MRSACRSCLGVHALRLPFNVGDSRAPDSGNTVPQCTVVRPTRRVEIQIRTQAMHEVAESGVAAHWSYRDGVRSENLFAVDPAKWIASLSERYDSAEDHDEFLEHVKMEMYADKVFCFTPRGDVVKLPRGATPLDFAYAIHTRIGDNCVGAKVDGVRATLWTRLRNGQSVDFMRAQGQRPHGTWIDIVATGRAKYAVDTGTVPDAAGITALQGTATYSGGAAGKYALYSATGGTNDAGHFTADATLEADFSNNVITGTIDNFMGTDGESRNWSVESMTSVVADGGAINGSAAQRTATETLTDQKTVWTIDGTAAAAAGAWSGSLQNSGDDDVPKIATGTFTSEYSTAGEMVGAFGVNKQ